MCRIVSTIVFPTLLVPFLASANFRPDYKLAVKYSLLYYEAQKSGKLPENNRIKWRGDSALQDKGLNGENLSGGYYDSSDFVKFGFTTAYTITILSWGLMSYEDAYKTIGQYEEVLKAIKWAADYFIKCHVSPHELYGQVGDFTTDHTFWGRPEEMTMSRPAYKIDEKYPGSDLAGQVSSVFSSASIVFDSVDKPYSQLLLNHSIELYEFGKKFRGLSKDSIPGAQEYYESTSYGDKLAWAALWLYQATKNTDYLTEAEQLYEEFDLDEHTTNKFFYNDQIIAIKILLAEISRKNAYIDAVREFCDSAVDRGYKTPKGLIYISKIGTLAHAANIAFICMKASDLPDFPQEKYLGFATTQIDYILGSSGRSYVIGYGDEYPKRPYHSASSCPDLPAECNWNQFNSSDPNPQILYGAIVSGPDENDFYEDKREEFLYNEVSLDYNAGFQSAMAGLIYFQTQENVTESETLVYDKT